MSLLLITSCNNSEKSPWSNEANGIWKLSIGNKNQINLISAANAKPNIVKLNEFDPIDFPFNSDEIKITELDNKIYLRFPLEKDEQIYGLGLQFKNIIRNQKIYNLQVDHYGGEDNGRTHAPVPFYVSSKGYGILINSAHYMTIYVGTSVLKDSKNPPKVYDRNTDKDWSA